MTSGEIEASKTVVRWGEFEFDPGRGELRRRGLKVKLQPMVLQVLSLLVERPGEVVTREKLHHEIWNGYAYSDFDHNLNIAINKLRAALSDPAKAPRFIETVPQSGYRFIAPVEFRPETAPSSAAVPIAAPAMRPRLAVGMAAALVLVFVGVLAFSRRVTPGTNPKSTTEAPPAGAKLNLSARWSGPSQFDGTAASHVRIPANPLLEPETITVEAWVRASELPALFSYVVAKGAHECSEASYAIYTTGSGALRFYVSDWKAMPSAFASPGAGSDIWDGKWHHMAGTFDGSKVRLFVDGLQVGDGTPTPPGFRIRYGLPQDNDLLIGSYGGCDGWYGPFNGEIEGVTVFNHALTPQEVGDEFGAQSARRKQAVAP
ncbi:MAG: LamG-like jellyroll fold domain-containing protein [Candidatus Acidiferrales bacterium]